MISLLNKDINLVSGGALCVTQDRGLISKDFDLSGKLDYVGWWCCRKEHGTDLIMDNFFIGCDEIIRVNFDFDYFFSDIGGMRSRFYQIYRSSLLGNKWDHDCMTEDPV